MSPHSFSTPAQIVWWRAFSTDFYSLKYPRLHGHCQTMLFRVAGRHVSCW
ncbi:hypothetical protein GJA_1276 [Janthinobacterium agaricidamnosum NBRC 102515 = DSM 9628]|uniref:Uncharacterized protein n=1 Tax=Janthinobacterium agaricidamnosum NBRC 102515 = DSM 9628 TaxID=1349767 RepID=W0V3L0_9BURK|nr:hypothetical protein GJA_1276 [Janthinobacterium agaricidamnosum NBRC 102515 = DSM 9628]